MSIVATSSMASRFVGFHVRCSNTQPNRGFSPKKRNEATKDKGLASQQKKSTRNKPGSVPTQAPGLNSQFEGKSRTKSLDFDFEERLETVRRSALEQKKIDEKKEFGAIDYDAPVESEKKKIGLGTKIGVGVGVVVFGLLFALGDFIPSVSDSPTKVEQVIDNKLSEEEKTALKGRLKEYEAMLSASPKDPVALEGAVVTLTELGDYMRAAPVLQDLAKEKPGDPDVLRLLGEVKFALKDYEGSAAAYKLSAAVSNNIDFDLLRGQTNALLAAKKPDEAVQIILATRERLNTEMSNSLDVKTDGNKEESISLEVDPVQVEMLLGKAYSDWGHLSDAVSVYDQLISSHPNDFRGYLAKGIVLKENGNAGDAERMFIQARFFAPEKAKALVDRYARR